MSILRGSANPKRAMGAVRPARVLDVFVDDHGRPACACVDADGNTYPRVALVAPGGGGSYLPPTLGRLEEDALPAARTDEVLLALGDGPRPAAFALGSLFHAGDLGTVTAEDTAKGPDEDADARTNRYGRTLRYFRARVAFEPDGTLVLDLRATTRPLKVQLPADGFVRVAQDGAETTERTLLADATKNYVAGLVATVNALGARVAALEAALQAGGNAAVGPAPGDGFALAVKPLATTMQSTWSSHAAPTDALVASAFRISRKSRAEEGTDA